MRRFHTYLFVLIRLLAVQQLHMPMLGDINISEPGALIGFAGPRVVKEATGKDLPKDFQTSEFVLDHGFLDFISHRRDLKDNINRYLDLIQNQPIRK